MLHHCVVNNPRLRAREYFRKWKNKKSFPLLSARMLRPQNLLRNHPSVMTDTIAIESTSSQQWFSAHLNPLFVIHHLFQCHSICILVLAMNNNPPDNNNTCKCGRPNSAGPGNYTLYQLTKKVIPTTTATVLQASETLHLLHLLNY